MFDPNRIASVVDMIDVTLAMLLSVMFRERYGITKVYEACFNEDTACILWDDFVTVIFSGKEEQKPNMDSQSRNTMAYQHNGDVVFW